MSTALVTGAAAGGGPSSSSPLPSESVPHEILDFLDQGGGRSLAIRGEPGTGKTSLALELMLHLPGQRYFVSTRVDNARLTAQFPFLASQYAGTEVLDLASMRSERLIMKSDATRMTHILGGGPRGPSQNVDLDRFMVLPPPLQELYSRTPSGEGRATILIDSWEALVTDYRSRVQEKPQEALSEAELAETMLSLFSPQGTNLIFVRENWETNAVDYLVDGVIEARRDLYQRHIFRSLRLPKLRGVAVGNIDYPFTLSRGRFLHLGSSSRTDRVGNTVEVPPPGSRLDGTAFYWGHRALQAVLPPLLPGSVVLLETMGSAPASLVARINTHVGVANGSLGMPISIVLSEGVTPAVVRSTHHPQGTLAASLRVIWAVRNASPDQFQGFELPRDALFPFDLGADHGANIDELCELVLGKEPRPVGVNAVLSMLYAMCGREPKRIEPLLATLVQENRRQGGFLVMDAVQDEPGVRFLSSEATHHLRFYERDGLYFVENVRAGGPLFCMMVPSDPRRFPAFELVPVI